MAGQPMAADGGLSDITNLLNLVKDQKTTNTTSTNISKEGVTQQINDILQGTSGLAAVAGAQKSAGLYNGSTNTLLTNDLLARASAQVAAKNATTTQTTSKKASVTKGNIESLLATQALKKFIGSDTVKSGANSAIGSIADELGLPYGANNAATANALSSVSSAGPGAQVGDFTSLESSLISGTDVGTGSLADAVTSGSTTASAAGNTSVAGLEALDSAAASGVGTGATAAQLASINSGMTAGVNGAAADFFGADIGAAGASTGSADVAGLAAADSAAVTAEGDAGLGAVGAGGNGALAATGWGALALATSDHIKGIEDGSDGSAKEFLNSTGDLGTASVITGYNSGNMADSINPIARNLLDTVGLGGAANTVGKATDDVLHAVGDTAGWIVCTELLRQGRFNRKHYVAGLKVFQEYPKHLLAGYYIWATPIVAALRRNPNSWYSGIVQHVFSQRAEYLAARAGVSGARDTVYGQSISALMFGICWLIGQYLYRRDIREFKKLLGEFCGN